MKTVVERLRRYLTEEGVEPDANVPEGERKGIEGYDTLMPGEERGLDYPPLGEKRVLMSDVGTVEYAVARLLPTGVSVDYVSGDGSFRLVSKRKERLAQAAAAFGVSASSVERGGDEEEVFALDLPLTVTTVARLLRGSDDD